MYDIYCSLILLNTYLGWHQCVNQWLSQMKELFETFQLQPE